jgi:hypothetical protein
MDEGAVVAYSARVLDGAVPHRDFLTLYGPGNIWLVAGAFKAFGTSVATERAVGLVYRIVIALSLFALALRLGGLLAGALAGIVSVMIMANELIWAYATYGAIAFALLGIALFAHGATDAPGRRRLLILLSAGIASGLAVLIRFDFAPAVAAAALPLLAFVSWRDRLWYGAGLMGLSALYAPHLAFVGFGKAERLLRDLVATEPGRRLPLPRPWEFPGSLLAASLVVTVLLVLTGAVLLRRKPRELVGRVLLSAGLFNVLLLPLTISRADVFHIRPFALVPLSLLPGVALLLTRSRFASAKGRTVVAVVIASVSLYGVISLGPLSVDRLRAVRGVHGAYRGFYDKDSRETAREVVEQARRLTRPGDSLFVGPLDLRRTNYGPTYMYFLLPQLRPASYYMEMNPLTANREGSRLADELGRADWLILTSEWDNWDEPNESSRFGPSEPNKVVRELFCVRHQAGQYGLFERCDRTGNPTG